MIARLRRLTPVLFVGLVIAGIVTPALALSLTSRDRLPGVSPVQPEIWVRPAQGAADRRLPVALVALGATATDVLSPPGMNGVVTAVWVGRGDTLDSGRPLVSVDGVVRRFVVGATPFWRDMSFGMSGSDVDLLHRHLATVLGEPAWAAGETYDARTAQAVSRYAEENGVPPPADGSRTEVASPSWFVYSPVAGLTVERTALVVGAPAPVTGQVVVSGRTKPVSVSVRDRDRNDLEVTPPPDASFSIGDATVSVADLANMTPAVAEVLASLRPITAPAADEGSGSPVAPEGGSGGDSAFAATMILPLEGRYQVPPTAIRTTSGGRQCIAVRRRGRQEGITVDVVSAAASGPTLVEADLDGVEVLTNPTVRNAGKVCKQ